MKRSRRRCGATLMELVVSSLLMIILGIALATLLSTSYNSKDVVVGQNNAYAQARNVVDTLADHIRNAQRYTTNNQVMSAAAAADITIYSDNTGGNTVEYKLDTTTSPKSLKMITVSGGTTTTTTLLSGMQSLQFTYYVGSGSAFYNASGSWTTTTSPNAPTAAELPNVGAIQITANVSVGGYNREISSFVRLRNSPYKTAL
jgi:type II secretory pathway pseudopilin PulG